MTETTEYQPYQHVEKLASSAVQGLLDGTVYVYPKVDGTNAKMWLTGEGLHFGSRKRELSLEKDNGRFMAWALDKPHLRKCLEELNERYGEASLFGEWLIPHTLKTYKEEAWRRFWVFDVYLPETDRYLTFEEYQPILEAHGVDYLPLLAKLDSPTNDELLEIANSNTFMIEEGKGLGEGIVIKRYDFKNKWGHTKWGKIVLSDFKIIQRSNINKGQLPKEPGEVETHIVDSFYTRDIADKVLAKLINENDGDWDSKLIGKLIQTCWYDFITENMWDILKKQKNPTINFKELQSLVNARTKEHLEHVF